jgi:Tfp pilus assembly protein PilN
MTYFRINLNRLEDTAAAQRKARAGLALFIGLAFAAACLFAGALYLNARLGAKVRAFERTARELDAKIQKLRQSGQYISEEEVYSLDRLNSRRVFWTRKLETLAGLVGERIALTEIKYERGVLYVRGIARLDRGQNNFGLVSDFLERIKAEAAFARDFREINFRSSNRVEYMDQDLLNFDIVMNPGEAGRG